MIYYAKIQVTIAVFQVFSYIGDSRLRGNDVCVGECALGIPAYAGMTCALGNVRWGFPPTREWRVRWRMCVGDSRLRGNDVCVGECTLGIPAYAGM